MTSKFDLELWLQEALSALGGKSKIVPICKKVWERHESELRESDALYFTWQYDIR
jgi:hypothetical protein